MHVYLHPTLNLLLGQKMLRDPSLNNKEIEICQNACIKVQKLSAWCDPILPPGIMI